MSGKTTMIARGEFKKGGHWALSQDKTTEGAAELFIYGDIGESWDEASVSAADLVSKLAEIKASHINVRINSYGGSVTDGTAIYNALTRRAGTVDTHVDGVAASMASLIAMAGRKIHMAENALMMIHAPWGVTIGNAAEHRRAAETLDRFAEAMTAPYVRRAAEAEQANVKAMLTDGQDHWLTAEQAKAIGLVTDVTEPNQLAASFDLSRFKQIPAALAALKTENHVTTAAPAAQATPEAAPATAAPQVKATESAEQVAARIKARNESIRLVFANFLDREGVRAIEADCLADPAVTVEQAQAKLLEAISTKDATPTAAGAHVEVGPTDREKFVNAAGDWLIARAAVKGAPKLDGQNPFRGFSCSDIARECLARAGKNTRGMGRIAVIEAALTHSTSDFPVIFENAMHKSLMAGFNYRPGAWRRVARVGTVSDFRAHNRYQTGGFSDLLEVAENGEYQEGTIPDADKESIKALRKGRLLNITREMLVNDDMGVFSGITFRLGQAANRVVDKDVFGLFSKNGGNGPTLGDGKAMFHADHGNISAVATGPTMDSFEENRVAMASQQEKGPDGTNSGDYLDIRPEIWLGPMNLAGRAREVNAAEFNDEATKNQRRPNISRGLYRDIVDTPRLAGTAWYSLADPNVEGVIEVAFLDGVETPRLDQEQAFRSDGLTWKVAYEYGVAGVGYRGIRKNPGA